MLSILKAMQDGKIDNSMGICDNVLLNNGNRPRRLSHKAKLRRLFKSWPQYSGSIVFPINAGTDTPEQQYWHCDHIGNFWEGEQGKLRHSLLTHMIKELSNEVT